MRTKFIVNPMAGSGKCMKHWKTYLKERVSLFPNHEISYTVRPREATDITRTALRFGFEKIIAVGGDGTLNEVVNGFFEGGELISPNAFLGMLPLGTGADFPINFSYPSRKEDIFKVLANKHYKKTDVGKIIYGKIPQKKVGYFINIASFGCSSEVVVATNKNKKPLGNLSYLTEGVWTFLKAKPKVYSLKKEGQDTVTQYLSFNVFVANGLSNGGGMKWAPQAQIDDGCFDVIILGQISKWKMPLLIPHIYKGTVLSNKEVEMFRARKLEVSCEGEMAFEVDGEIMGTLPATFEILPKCINFLC